MKRLWQVTLLELQNLFCKKAVWTAGTGFAGITATVCLSETLRTAYFSGIECVPVMLFSQLAPPFLVLMLLCALSDAFAGERQQGVESLAVVCRAGWRGRGAAKLLAALLLCVAVGLFFSMVSCALPFAAGLLDVHQPLAGIGGELALSPVWTVGQHCVFSVLSLFLGCFHVALLVLFCSRRAKRTIDAAAMGGSAVLLEWLFHRFSFPAPLRVVNVWMFFTPYEFFVADLFGTEFSRVGPLGNLLFLTAVFLPFSIAALCVCMKRTA